MKNMVRENNQMLQGENATKLHSRGHYNHRKFHGNHIDWHTHSRLATRLFFLFSTKQPIVFSESDIFRNVLPWN